MKLKLLMRSLLLQACWNFERMQNIGFCFVLEPWLRRIYPELPARLDALGRHQEYFNTNPYMASLIVGTVCALEEEAAVLLEAQNQEKLARISLIKKAAASPLAGLGDTLFWQTLRPFCAATALFVGLALWKVGLVSALIGMAACYLLVYNMAALNLRCRGLSVGYEWKEQIASRLKSYPWQNWIKRLRYVGTLMALALILAALAYAGGARQRAVGVVALLSCLIADRIRLRPVPVNRLYGGAVVVGILASAAGWI